MTEANVFVGMKVRRGRDWIYKDKDGPGNTGTVKSQLSNDAQKVKVDWGRGPDGKLLVDTVCRSSNTVQSSPVQSSPV